MSEREESKQSPKVLVVDDEPAMVELLRRSLERKGYLVQTAANIEGALAAFRTTRFSVVLTDLRLADEDGLDLAQQILAIEAQIPVVVMTAFGNLETAIAAIRAGVYDFVTKPIQFDALSMVMNRAVRHAQLLLELGALRAQVEQRQSDSHGIVGKSAAMQRIFSLIERVAGSDSSVVVAGESGTGKELVARAIHQASERSAGPFVAINCAAVPAQLLESELFGHAKGAFTDAKTSRVGLVQQANGGTLFLDEIGEMPVDMQPKLLRVLQEKKVRPVGGNHEQSVDLRILAATNRDLEAEVEAGRFREDLFYRINVVSLYLPALRHRGKDILLLAQHFLRRHGPGPGGKAFEIPAAFAKKLVAYDWPGNVRELENCIERATTLAMDHRLSVADLPARIRDFKSSQLLPSHTDPEELPTLEDMENRYILQVLKVVGGNKTQAAKVLGVERRTLYRRLEKLEAREDSTQEARR